MYPSVNEEDKFPLGLYIHRGRETWHYDNISEFYSDYHTDFDYAYLRFIVHLEGELEIDIDGATMLYSNIATKVSVQDKKREHIEHIFSIFEDAVEDSHIPEPVRDSSTTPVSPPEPWEKSVIIFIGHGKDDSWRDLKDHLQDKHRFKVIAYEIGARAGHGIRDVLEDMLDEASFALLVFSGENIDDQGRLHARENVIHELGLFQGKLGFKKAIVLLEENVEIFSNINGVQYIRYPRKKIKETFGDVLATIKREFQPDY